MLWWKASILTAFESSLLHVSVFARPNIRLHTLVHRPDLLNTYTIELREGMIVDNWLRRLHDLRLVLWMLDSHLVIGPHPSWLCLQRLKSPLHVRQRRVIFRVLQGAVIVRVAIGPL